MYGCQQTVSTATPRANLNPIAVGPGPRRRVSRTMRELFIAQGDEPRCCYTPVITTLLLCPPTGSQALPPPFPALPGIYPSI